MGGFSDSKQVEFVGRKISNDTLPELADDSVLTATFRLGPGGRVVIPVEMRDAMGLKQGDALIAKLSGGELTMVTLMGTIRELHALVKGGPAAISLVDEFIREKRAEAAKEDEESRDG
jgi:bifunctional DNA-binding transcriptional regulator/antitoxin component of YhaV-PrlF toxin-antitoxin module